MPRTAGSLQVSVAMYEQTCNECVGVGVGVCKVSPGLETAVGGAGCKAEGDLEFSGVSLARAGG